MPPTVKISVWEDDRTKLSSAEVELPLELGRQGFFVDGDGKQRCEPSPGELYSQKRKLVIAPFHETKIGRVQALIEAKDAKTILVQNKHNSVAFHLENGQAIPPNDRMTCPLPVILKFARENGKNVLVGIAEGGSPDPIAEKSTQLFPQARITQSILTLTKESLEPADLVKWLKSVFDVLNSASSNSDFYARAAQSAVEMADLDHAQVILKEKGSFEKKALFPLTPESERIAFSKRVLDEVIRSNETLWKPIEGNQLGGASLESVDEIVAAPINDPHGEPIGVLYGLRKTRPFTTGTSKKREPISEVEASLVEVLAGVVSAGISRLEQEKAALSARIQMEQVFTAELAHQLAEIPDWGIGKVMEITVLFCDIKEFTKISEKLSPNTTIRWIQDVLGILSDCILLHDGVLVNYIGDAIMAIWGAPNEKQTNHAELACRAALEMASKMASINEKWESVIQAKTEVTIGINTGTAQVGNIGSVKKIQYGAHGSTVNLASRIQGINKYLKTKMLISETTHKKIDNSIHNRKIGKIRPNNFESEITLFELFASDDPHLPHIKKEYEEALELFEKNDFQECAKKLVTWRSQCNGRDETALVLVSRAVSGMLDGPATHHPIWVLKEK